MPGVDVEATAAAVVAAAEGIAAAEEQPTRG